jgi:CheY-like chemotaxis protein
VIGNLLNNAAKYTKEGGQIWLTAREEGEVAVLSVRDTGLGIPAEMLPHVFDMFAQVDRTLNRSQGGLGIGLTLAKSLIEMHGGSIEAHSDGAGKGSEFMVRLPIARGKELTCPASSVSSCGSRLPAPAGHRILVLDDTPSAAYILGKLLEKLGHQVRTVHDAASALDYARVARPDVIISDIGMPNIDGYEFARRIRQEPGLEQVMLVALTGYGQRDHREQAIESGFDFHLVKPVSLEALQETLARFSFRPFASPADRLREELSS